jgi:hypothetical protein
MNQKASTQNSFTATTILLTTLLALSLIGPSCDQNKPRPASPPNPSEEHVQETKTEQVGEEEYPKLLARIKSRVEEEYPGSPLPKDLIGPKFEYSVRQGDGPFLLLSIDLIKVENSQVVGIMGGIGVKAVEAFLAGDPAMLQGKSDAFLILCNFPVFEERENLFYDLAKHGKNSAVRVGAILALRNDVLNQREVCPFLSTLLQDSDHDVQYAALLALASSPSMEQYKEYNPLMPEHYFSTDQVLTNINALMKTGFQVKMSIPIARILCRTPYNRNPKTLEMGKSLESIKMSADSPGREYYEDCLALVGLYLNDKTSK